jgi:hypothetical protein
LIENIRRCQRRNVKDGGALSVEYGLMTLVASLVAGVIFLLGQLSADGVSQTCESVTMSSPSHGPLFRTNDDMARPIGGERRQLS